MTPLKRRTISLRIDPIQTRSRVAQFFDSTTRTIANELLQNARRAGATRVDITVDDGRVTIRDDGRGIDDPAVLLNFGRSHWDADTLRRETPAGMGLASLARRTATIETRPPGARPEDGWCVTLTPSHWRGSFAEVHTKTVAGGTSVSFKLLDSDHQPIMTVLENAARYYPVPVTVNGEPVRRNDFLAACVKVDTFPGGRIGAVDTQRPSSNDNYCFHGAPARGPGTQVSGYLVDQEDRENRFRWRIQYDALFDIDDNHGIEPVLPARKSVIADEKTHRLVQQANAFLWATMIERHPDVLLTAADRSRIKKLGLRPPPEPPEQLKPWSPEKADSNQTRLAPDRDIRPSPTGPWIMDLADEMPAADQAVVGRALEQAGLTDAVFEPDPFLDGYRWYDRLPRIRRAAIQVVTAEGTTDLEQIRTTDSTWSDTGIVKVQVVLDIDGGERRTLETDLVFLSEEEPWEPEVHVAEGSKIDPAELTDLICDAWFSPSDDCESDSYQTQAENYRDAARYIAMATLESSEKAEDDRLTTQIEHALSCSTLATGDTVNVTRIDHGYDIRIERAAQ